MAAPEIPNLNSLRNVRGAGLLRGRGRGQAGLSGANLEEEKAAKDKIIQQTDQDASVSRLSAVEAGYLDDPYAKFFVSGEVQKRFPMLNRGAYLRTKAIDNLVNKFLAHNPSQKKQIISLGAGSDTRFFRLMSAYPKTDGLPYDPPNLVYHEIDFSVNTIQKLASIKKYSELCRHVKPPWRWTHSSDPMNTAHEKSDTLEAGNYHVHAIDLRTLDPSSTPPPSFKNIDPALPTIIISECCLVYLTPAAADTVALYFTQHLFPPSTLLGLILYEPINPHDPFGKVMVSNLSAHGIVLQTWRKYGSLEAQAARMKAYGFEGSKGFDMNGLWQKGVDEREKERVAGLEMLDEVEEWELLAAHYCVVWGWRGDREGGNWEGWQNIGS